MPESKMESRPRPQPYQEASRTPEPFLRWAGGKQWLESRVPQYFPKTYRTYFEPFLGGGAIFLALSPRRAVLGDLNQALIETFKAVRDSPEEVIYWLRRWVNKEETYYQIRSITYLSSAKKAARLIYLNKTCWNGLFRVNRMGKFNVPYGKTPQRRTHDPQAILQASKRLKNSSLSCGDFEITLKDAKSSDLVYLDPPYTTMHSDNGFRRYNETLFSWQDQLRLAATANRLVHKGCFVVLSNGNYPDIRNLYRDFTPIEIDRKSTLAADPHFRRSIKELLLLSNNFPVQASSGSP